MPSQRAARLQALRRWLERHHQIITTAEADALGIHRAERRRLVDEGALVHALPGVWVTGSATRTPELILRAAVKGAPAGTAAVEMSAAWWLGLTARAPARPQIAIRPASRLRWEEVTVRRTIVLGDTRSVRDLAVTTPERTIVDLAARPQVVDGRLDAMVDAALAGGLTTFERLAAAAQPRRERRVRGAPRLRALLDRRGDLAAPTASVLEHRTASLLAELCKRHGLELPVAEHEVLNGQLRLDFAWPRLRLAVEVDGWAWHGDPARSERDKVRRNRLVADGWAVLVFSWRQVTDDPGTFCAEVLEAYRRAEAA